MKEFINSDILWKPKKYRRIYSILCKISRWEPNNPTAIDTVFNLFAYTSPRHLSRIIDFESELHSTNDGKIVITATNT